MGWGVKFKKDNVVNWYVIISSSVNDSLKVVKGCEVLDFSYSIGKDGII